MNAEKQKRKIFGKEIKRKSFSDFGLVECLYPAKATMPRHTHEIAHGSFVLAGNFTEKCGGRERLTNSSSLIIHPPDEDHVVKFYNAGARVFSFNVKNRMLRKIRDFTDALDAPAVFVGRQSARLAAELYRESRATDAVAPLVIEALVFEIIAASSRQIERLRERNVPCWLEQAREFLHAPFAENISFAALAETVGTHPVRLAREFRRRFGCTMGEYVHRLRIETACHKISELDLPLGEIALMTGFYDQSPFTNIFKRLTRITPAAYRALFRQS